MPRSSWRRKVVLDQEYRAHDQNALGREEFQCNTLQRFRRWNGNNNNTAEELLRAGTRLVLVSAKQAKDGRFHAFLRQSNQRIGTLVFDEAPLFSSSPF